MFATAKIDSVVLDAQGTKIEPLRCSPHPRRLSAPMIHALGSLSLIGYVVMVWLASDGSPMRVVAGLSLWLLLFVPYSWLCFRTIASEQAKPQDATAGRTGPILLWALLFRVALLPAGITPEQPMDQLRLDLGGEEAGYQSFLLWDNDVWRYLWDGHVMAAGISPYVWSPSALVRAADEGELWAEELVDSGPWWDVLDRMSYGEYQSIYPPLALAAYALSHQLVPGSVLVWKTLLASLEFLGCWVFALLLARTGRSPQLVLLLAWNPLLIKEVAGSGHVDGLLVPTLCVALFAVSSKRGTLAISALTAAVLIKLWPILFTPALLLRTRWQAWWPLPVGLLAGYWPFRHELSQLAQAFRTFTSEWVFNPGPWLAIEQLAEAFGTGGRAVPDLVHLLLSLGAVAATSWFALSKRTKAHRGECFALNAIARDWFIIGALFMLFSATVMPWYLIALLPLAVLIQAWPWITVTAAAVLSYGIYINGNEAPWVLAIEFGVMFSAWLWWRWRRVKHHGTVH